MSLAQQLFHICIFSILDELYDISILGSLENLTSFFWKYFCDKMILCIFYVSIGDGALNIDYQLIMYSLQPNVFEVFFTVFLTRVDSKV